MYLLNVTDYDNMTDYYNDSLSINSNCTIYENNIDKIIPALLITIPCGLSFLCLKSHMVYFLTYDVYNSIINENGEVFISKSSSTLHNMRAEFIWQISFSNKFIFKYY